MRLDGWEKVSSAEEYREMIKAEYYRLQNERSGGSAAVGMEEVKLRLFLSLLDKPVVDTKLDTSKSIASDMIS